MAYVPVPKDLTKVKTKVAFNLTKRQINGERIGQGRENVKQYIDEHPQSGRSAERHSVRCKKRA